MDSIEEERNGDTFDSLLRRALRLLSIGTMLSLSFSLFSYSVAIATFTDPLPLELKGLNLKADTEK